MAAELSAEEIGERLRLARETVDAESSQTSADSLKIARTTLVAVEQGQRRARMDEIRQLAKLYGTSVNALLRREAVHVDLAPKFRKHFAKSDEATEQAAKLLSELAQAEVELENLLGVQRVRNYPPKHPFCRRCSRPS